MRTLKISPSVINNFSRYLDESLEYETYERLIEKFEKPIETTEKMAFGTACHKLIENPEKYKVHQGYVVQNDKREAMVIGETTNFSNKLAQPLVDFHYAHPRMVYEQRHRKVYMVKGYTVVMSMRIDGIEVGEVYDFKVSSSAPKVDEYMNSMQWKSYLDATELPVFKYQVFQHHGRKPNKIITAHDPVVIYSYPSLREEVEHMIELFITFLEDTGFITKFYFEL